MWVFMLGFAGFPFTGGMIGKFYVFAAAYEAGWWWLIVIGVIATAVSVYYYLAVVRAMYMRPSSARADLVVAGGSPARDLALHVDGRGRARGHDRLVLLRAAADRPGHGSGRRPPLLAGPRDAGAG